MAAAEVGEDAEVSTILQDHPLLVPTRSDASFHSLQYSQYTSEGEWYQLHTIIKKAIIGVTLALHQHRRVLPTTERYVHGICSQALFVGRAWEWSC